MVFLGKARVGDAQARETGADPKASKPVEQNAESPHPEFADPELLDSPIIGQFAAVDFSQYHLRSDISQATPKTQDIFLLCM